MHWERREIVYTCFAIATNSLHVLNALDSNRYLGGEEVGGVWSGRGGRWERRRR